MKTRRLFLVLVIVFVVQTFHFTEHIVQLIQIYALGIKPPLAHGLLGSVFDFEWVHFAFNSFLEVNLVGLWLAYRGTWPTKVQPTVAGAMPLLTGVMLFQGYHTIEHIVKLYQYLFIPLYRSGMVPTPGILPPLIGWPVFLVHFAYNLIVWALLALVVWNLRATYLNPELVVGQH